MEDNIPSLLLSAALPHPPFLNSFLHNSFLPPFHAAEFDINQHRLKI